MADLIEGGASTRAVGAIVAGNENVPAETPSPTPAPAPVESYAPPAPKATAPTNAQNFQAGIARVRAAGYSWDDIGQQLAPKFEQARNAGFTPTEISRNLGFSSSDPILAAVKNHLADALPADGSIDVDKIRGIYADAIHSQRISNVRDFAKGIIGKAGEVLEGIGQGASEAAKNTLGEKAPGETAMQTLNRVIGADITAPFTIAQGAVAGGLAAAGAPRLGRDLAALPEAFMGSPSAFHIGVEGVAQKLPTPNDLTDNALALQLKTTGKIGDTKPVIDNLVSGWAKTGEDPATTVQRADSDPHLRQSLLTEQPPEPPIGSSETPTTHAGNFVIPKNTPEPTAVPTQHSVVRDPSQPEAVDLAMAQSGRHSNDVKHFLEQGGQDLDPTTANWCAAFANSALEQSGIAGSGSNVATSFLRWGNEVNNASQVLENDVVVLPRGHAAGETGGHVGIATGDTRFAGNGLEVEMVSGNSEGKVRTTWEKADEIQVRRGSVASTAAVRPDELGLIRQLENSGDNAISPKGARGRFQMMPDTARELGYEPSDMANPDIAREAAQKYLDKIHGMGITRTEDVLVAWNAGPNAARKWIDAGRHVEDLPTETQKYLARAEDEHGVVSTLKMVERNAPGEAGAIGNAGPKTQLETDLDLMGSRIGDDRQGWTDWLKDAGGATYREMFRPDHPLNVLQDAIEKGTPLADAENPRFLRRLAENSESTAQYTVERKMVDLQGREIGPGLKEILQPLGIEGNKDFWNYSVARWAVEKAEQAKETGVETEAAKRVVAALETRYGATFDKLVAYQNGTLSWLKEAGLITPEQFAQMVEANKSRIPGYRIDEEGVSKPGAGTGASRGVKAFFGSEAQIQHPLKSILQDAYVRAQIARRNIANRAMVDAAEQAGFAERVKAVPRKFELSPDEMKKFGVDEEEASVWRAIGHDLRPNEAPVFRDGKLEAWKVADGDPDIARYMRGMDSQQLATWQKMIRPFSSFQRASIALNPLFPIRLMMYDLPWQFITKPGMRNSLADFLTGLKHTLGDTPEYDAYLKSGGAERVFAGMSKDQHIADLMRGKVDPTMADGVWNLIRGGVGKMQAWSQLLTGSMKAGRYIRGVRAGESEIRASALSSEAAFHRAGFGGPAAKALNSLHPFTAAYLNGLEQTARSLFGIGKTTGGDEFKAWQTISKAAAIITVPMLWNWAANKDKEWYRAAHDWQKNSGLLFHFGADDGGHTLFLPFPPILGTLFGGLPRMLADGFYHDEKTSKIAKDAAMAALTSVIPSTGLFLAGNAVQPLLEHVANYSFFRGQPQVSDQAKKNLPPEQASPWTSGAAKTMAKFLPFSPPVIDNYIQGWGGTLGVAAVRAADIALGTGPRANNPVPLSIEDMPLLSSWLARYPSASAQPIKDFSTVQQHFEAVHGSLIAAMKAGNVDRFKEILADNPGEATAHKFNIGKEAGAIIGEQGPVGQFLPLLQSAQKGDKTDVQDFLTMQKSVTEMRKLVQIYQAAPATANLPTWNVETGKPMEYKHMTPTDKKQQLDALYNMMQRASEKGLAAYNKLTRR